MKHSFKRAIFLTLFVLTAACGQTSELAPSSGPSAIQTSILTAIATTDQIPTIAIESTLIQFDDLSALPTITIPDGTNLPFPTLNPNRPTLLPTIDPNLVPNLLRESISIQTLKGANGHNLQRITGWDYGFRHSPCYGYQWLDSNHLLLYPRTGQWKNIYRDGGGREDLGSEPVVINLATGNFWLRPPSSVSISSTDTPRQDCNSVYWSRALGIIINQQQYGTTFGPVKDVVFTYTFDGQQVAEYWGKILGVSPSGEKILVDEDTIIDLRNNQVIDLAWHMNYSVGDSPTLYWSSDETRLYRCCFYYADLKTGESYNFNWGDLHEADGQPLTTSMHPHQYGHWVRNNSYFLIEWDYWTIFYGDPIPMFSPSNKKYYDIGKIAEIPAAVVSTSTSDVSPDGGYVWIKGYGDDGQYHGFLINLANSKTASYNKPIDEFEWSPDSKFAWMTIYDSSDEYILSADKTTLTLFPAQPTSNLFWHPTNPVLAFLTEKNQVLTILNAKDMSVKGWPLPATFYDLIWSPDGDHIAFVATDGSLWQVDYPKLENFEQLTEPMPSGGIQWSPDGNSIAFVNGSDIYIVGTTK